MGIARPMAEAKESKSVPIQVQADKLNKAIRFANITGGAALEDKYEDSVLAKKVEEFKQQFVGLRSELKNTFPQTEEKNLPTVEEFVKALSSHFEKEIFNLCKEGKFDETAQTEANKKFNVLMDGQLALMKAATPDVVETQKRCDEFIQQEKRKFQNLYTQATSEQISELTLKANTIEQRWQQTYEARERGIKNWRELLRFQYASAAEQNIEAEMEALQTKLQKAAGAVVVSIGDINSRAQQLIYAALEKREEYERAEKEAKRGVAYQDPKTQVSVYVDPNGKVSKIPATFSKREDESWWAYIKRSVKDSAPDTYRTMIQVAGRGGKVELSVSFEATAQGALTADAIENKGRINQIAKNLKTMLEIAKTSGHALIIDEFTRQSLLNGKQGKLVDEIQTLLEAGKLSKFIQEDIRKGREELGDSLKGQPDEKKAEVLEKAIGNAGQALNKFDISDTFFQSRRNEIDKFVQQIKKEAGTLPSATVGLDKVNNILNKIESDLNLQKQNAASAPRRSKP